MSYGYSAQGWRAKRLADVAEETKLDWQEEFGLGFDLDPRTPAGAIKGILDERMAKIWELGGAIVAGVDPDSAEGAQFDAVLALTGNARRRARKSIVDSGRGRGVFGTTIPVGTIISVLGNSEARFVTDVATQITIPSVDEVQKIAFSAIPTAGIFQIELDGETTGALNYNDSLATIQAAIEALATVGSGNVVVTGSVSPTGLSLAFQSGMGAQDVPTVTVPNSTLVNGITAVTTTITTPTPGDMAKTPIMTLTAEDTGPTQAPAGSLTVIETPVVGLVAFTNEEDAELGEDTEEDQPAKQRRNNELTIAGAATINAIRADLLTVEDVTAVVVFQNNKAVVDAEGRPPKSLDIVVEGGDEDDIADAIFNSEAGGIETIGDISKIVIDDQGFAQEVKFSRPEEVFIWVEADIEKDPELYPVDGDARVAAGILAMGLRFTIGKTVIVYGSDPSLGCSFDDVPGIVDFELRVGTTASPTTDANVPITARQKSKFDSARITVVSS